MKMLEDRGSREGLLGLTEEELRSVRRNAAISDVYLVEDNIFARGKFATVRKASHKVTGVQYAAKYIKKRRRAVDMTPEIYHEISVLMRCTSSGRVVRLHEVYETNSDVVLVLELAAGGELQRIFDTDQCLSEVEARRAMRQILEGLSFLHERNIAHLDLKPQNLLLTVEDSCDDIKLCDFGVSRILEPGTEVRALLGTPDYVAPEVLSYEPISLATDVWSVGVLAYVLLSGFTPFGADTKQQTYLNISQCILTFEPDHFSDVSGAAMDFIKKTLVVNPRCRPTVQDLLQHPWMSQKAHILPTITMKTNESPKTSTTSMTPVGQRTRRNTIDSEDSFWRLQKNVEDCYGEFDTNGDLLKSEECQNNGLDQTFETADCTGSDDKTLTTNTLEKVKSIIALLENSINGQVKEEGVKKNDTQEVHRNATKEKCVDSTSHNEKQESNIDASVSEYENNKNESNEVQTNEENNLIKNYEQQENEVHEKLCEKLQCNNENEQKMIKQDDDTSDIYLVQLQNNAKEIQENTMEEINITEDRERKSEPDEEIIEMTKKPIDVYNFNDVSDNKQSETDEKNNSNIYLVQFHKNAQEVDKNLNEKINNDILTQKRENQNIDSGNVQENTKENSNIDHTIQNSEELINEAVEKLGIENNETPIDEYSNVEDEINQQKHPNECLIQLHDHDYENDEQSGDNANEHENILQVDNEEVTTKKDDTCEINVFEKEEHEKDFTEEIKNVKSEENNKSGAYDTETLEVSSANNSLQIEIDGAVARSSVNSDTEMKIWNSLVTDSLHTPDIEESDELFEDAYKKCFN